MVERIPMLCLDFKQFSFNHLNGLTLLVDRESKLIYQWVTKCYGSYIYMIIEFHLFRSNSSRSYIFLSYFLSYFLLINKRTERKYRRLDPTYSWNKQLAHTPFPKKINTPSTILRFIGFVAKISVLNAKLPANG